MGNGSQKEAAACKRKLFEILVFDLETLGESTKTAQQRFYRLAVYINIGGVIAGAGDCNAMVLHTCVYVLIITAIMQRSYFTRVSGSKNGLVCTE